MIELGGVKADQDKPRLDLISWPAMKGLSQVLAFGAKKYQDDNWRKGFKWRRLIAAAGRHLMAFSDGEDLDEESGLSHVDHAQCCLMFLSEHIKCNLGEDDRYKRHSADPELIRFAEQLVSGANEPKNVKKIEPSGEITIESETWELGE